MSMLRKVCLQPGHWKRTTGAVGAPGEQKWNVKITGMITNILLSRGADVYMADAFADKDTKVTGTDWDLFLSIHYDADIYNDRGGFVDVPETDYVAKESRRIANIIRADYFSKTKIPEKPSRSNANTRRYYMWSALSKNTPCVIIECGVGWRKPEDYNTLRNYDLIANTLADSICRALSISTKTAYELDSDIPTEIEDKFKLKEIERYNKYWTFNELIEDWVKLTKEYDKEREDRKKYQSDSEQLRKITEELAEQIAKITEARDKLDRENAGFKEEILQLKVKQTEISNERDSLTDVVEDYNHALKKCRDENQQLSDVILSQNPIEEYKTSELINEILNRFFAKLKGGDKNEV